jgi:transglutaminase-like putative cysteine protease
MKQNNSTLQIRTGYEIIYNCPQSTPMILMVHIHYSRAADILIPDRLTTDPFVPITSHRDVYGNWCSRIVAPMGRIRLNANAVIRDSGEPDAVLSSARQHEVRDLPEETLVFLLGSRYCETDLLSEAAWNLFSQTPLGWKRVKAICDFVHNHIVFGYGDANPTKTAWGAFMERKGVCRDFAHLAIAFCRCMNIPARYCTGYLGDTGTPPPWGVGDFAAWIEVYLDGEWHTFDPRNNVPRIGRVLMARGRDAADVAIATTFGPNTLESFKVWADEVEEIAAVSS